MTSTEGGRDDEAVCVVEELPLHPVVASADVAPVGGEAGVGEIAVSKSLCASPPPYGGGYCTRRDHVVIRNDEGDVQTIKTTDDRLWRCDCGVAMIGNGRVEIRFGLLDVRFPEAQ